MAERTVLKTHERIAVPLTNFEPTRTKQSFKEECDINYIVGKWRQTGEANHVNLGTPQYGDFSNADDYLTARNNVSAALDSFDALPALIRDRFENDPARLMDFMNDSSNEAEAIELGLIPDPVQARSVPPPAPPAEIPENPASIEGGD